MPTEMLIFADGLRVEAWSGWRLHANGTLSSRLDELTRPLEVAEWRAQENLEL